MKKYLISAAVLGAILLAASARDNDPVLMTVNNKDVTLSEFEYLYNKNNAQQLQPQTIDEYVEMFKNYKLKVADAEAAGLDTTASFRQELTKYCNDLAEPYLRDKAVEDSLARASYDHMLETRTVSHIMIPLDGNGGDIDKNYAMLDSLRSEILAGNTTFEATAKEYSIDRASSPRGGLMGPVIPGRYPWTFEDATYKLTAVGEISPVVNSGMGLHLIRLEKREPSKGEVHAAHILKLTRGVSEEQLPAVKASIDSVYAVVTAEGADFADVAGRESQDPGSARRGGDLGWFGSGVMVQPFDSIAFALADGAISEPFQTPFGYHIIKRYEHRGVAPYSEMHDKIISQMQQDQRGAIPAQRRLEQLCKEYDAQLIPSSIKAYLTGGDANLPAYTIGGKAVTVKEIAAKVAEAGVTPDSPRYADALQRAARESMNEAVLDLARKQLLATNDDYRNLTNEYRDGILMFDISNRNVWERASADTLGLQKFFEKNRGKYSFAAPKYKAAIVFTTSDSLLNAAEQYAAELGKLSPVEFTAAMRDKFGKEVKIERVIAAEGENAITDYLGFGKERPEDNKSRWKYYFAVDGKVIDNPEEVADVKGAVTSDYQNELEQEWLKKINKKYPVKINKKLLQSLSGK